MNQVPDTQPGPYYISVMKNSGDCRALSGPYEKHADALALVDKARRISEQMDDRAIWYAFGTLRIKDTSCTDPGILQKVGYNLALERETRVVRLVGTPTSKKLRAWLKKNRPNWTVIRLDPDPDNSAGSLATIAEAT